MRGAIEKGESALDFVNSLGAQSRLHFPLHVGSGASLQKVCSYDRAKRGKQCKIQCTPHKAPPR